MKKYIGAGLGLLLATAASAGMAQASPFSVTPDDDEGKTLMFNGYAVEKPRTSFIPFDKLNPAIPIDGYIKFCQRNAQYCDVLTLPPVRAKLNAASKVFSFETLERVNREVNAAIYPMNDIDLYKVREYWTFPTETEINGKKQLAGDCEDTVLMKIDRLVHEGWDISSLLIAHVEFPQKNDKGEEVMIGHAVLVVRTDKGDFVLDNQNNEIKPWNQTMHTFLRIQSPSSPRQWLAIDPSYDVMPMLSVPGLRLL